MKREFLKDHFQRLISTLFCMSSVREVQIIVPAPRPRPERNVSAAGELPEGMRFTQNLK